MPLLQRGSDPFCGRTQARAETILVGPGGGLQNALVRIAPGAVSGTFTAADRPVEIDQRDCMYRPRVQGALPGQQVRVANSDGTFHNVHARRLVLDQRTSSGTIFNRAQPPGAPPIETSARGFEIMELKCDSHGWMKGFVLVTPHPYFAVSDAAGKFTIDNVPAGTYELQAWHEFYGVKTVTVTVAPGAPAAPTIAYSAAERPLEQ
jgi:plastocyanin